MNMITMAIFVVVTMCLFHGAASMVKTTEYVELMPNDPEHTFLAKVDALHKCCPHRNWIVDGTVKFGDMTGECWEEREPFNMFASEDIKIYVYEGARWKYVYFAEEGLEYEFDKYRGNRCQFEKWRYTVSEMEYVWNICVPYNFEELEVETASGGSTFYRYGGELADGYTRTISIVTDTVSSSEVLCLPLEEVFSSAMDDNKATYTYTTVTKMTEDEAATYVSEIDLSTCEEYVENEACGAWIPYDVEDPETMERKKRDTSSTRDRSKRLFREMIKRNVRK